MPDMSGRDGTDTSADPRRPPHTADQTEDGHGIRAVDLEEVLRRRVSVRVRVARGLALLIAIAVATGLVVRSGALGSGRSQAGVGTPTVVPLGPILLLSTVSYGTVTLNGTALAGSPPLAVTFRRGVNTVTLTAPPFRPRTCHIQWPGDATTYSQSDGGCNLSPPGNLPHSVGGQPVTPVLVVELPLGLDDLPSAAQTQALAAVTAALQGAAPQTGVPAGDFIATGQDAGGAITSRRADTPLRAELVATATSLNYNGDLCDDPGCARAADVAGQHDGKLEWAVSADVSIRWRFSSGGVVASSAPWSDQLPETVLLSYDPLQGWSVDQRGTEQSAGFGLPEALTQDACDVDVAVLRSAAQQHGYTILSPLSDNRLEGCEFGVQTAQGANAGHFVWRFGVLLAADGPAHALLPDIPLAPVSEVAAAGG